MDGGGWLGEMTVAIVRVSDVVRGSSGGTSVVRGVAALVVDVVDG